MFEKNEKTKISRLADRGHYDKETIFKILDDNMLCTIAYTKNDLPFAIPTAYCRINEKLYIHGSFKSHFLSQLPPGTPVCLTVTALDGLVLARSVFHHSMNYHSVVVFGKTFWVDDPKEKNDILEVFTEKILPGRWSDARQPTDGELKATGVVGITMEDASAKIRTGPASDDKRDLDLPVWAGVLPFKKGYEEPIANPDLSDDIELPEYVRVESRK